MPPERHAAVIDRSALADTVAKSMIETDNMRNITFVDFRNDANASRPPDYFLYIYNIARRHFEIRRPPQWSYMKLAACPASESYIKVATVSNIIQEKWPDPDSGEIRYRGLMGERFCMDLINPVNIGVDMWAEITNEELTWIDGGSDDLSVRGLFWTRNDPPEDWELAKSKERLENFYRRKLEQARRYAQSDKTKDQIGDEHHLAAEYFKVREGWHMVAELPSLCPNCGEVLPLASVAYHKNSMGDRCVIDWRRAVDSGAIKYEDVPEAKRWKKIA